MKKKFCDARTDTKRTNEHRTDRRDSGNSDVDEVETTETRKNYDTEICDLLHPKLLLVHKTRLELTYLVE